MVDGNEVLKGQRLMSPIRSMAAEEEEAKAAAASNSHKEAERRRRKRINAHIATLKSILPNTIKTDKASLLSEAVRRVKELKKTTQELLLQQQLGDDNSPSSSSCLGRPIILIPSEADELKLWECEDDKNSIKATMSCEDREEMIVELIEAVKAAGGKVVRAEMCTVGGRTKMVLLINKQQQQQQQEVHRERDVCCLGTLKRALKMVMDKSTLLAGSGHHLQPLPVIKRPRYYQ